MNSTVKKTNSRLALAQTKKKEQTNSTKSHSAHQKARGFGVNKECCLLGLDPAHSFLSGIFWGRLADQRPDSDLNSILILTIEFIFEKHKTFYFHVLNLQNMKF